ncbi:ABC transporter ATP-binding protein [Methanocaldococcus sp.]
MIKVENLSFNYVDFEVLKDISFEVNQGEICAIFGPNGAGKSTLFKCIVGFLKPNKGRILVDGKDIINLSPKERAKILAYVPQEHKPSFPYLVKEIVLMGRNPHLSLLGPKKEDYEIACKCLRQVGIGHLADRVYSNLSGGQRQLVLLARALAQETNIMLLDEPTSALDFKNQLKIWDILKKLKESGITIIVTVHDPNHVLWFCDKVIILNKGEILDIGSPLEVLNENNIKKLYGDICSIKNIENLKVILPTI